MTGRLHHDIVLAAEVLEHETVALQDLLLQLKGIDLEEADLKAQLAVCFKIFAIYAIVKIRYNKSSRLTLLLESQIVVGFFNDIAQD